MGNKKKIAIVSNTMCIGGVEVALTELLKVLNYDRYHVILFLREPGGPLFSRIDKRVEIRFWGSQNSRNAFIDQFRNGHFLLTVKGLWNRLRARCSARDWARNAFFGIASQPSLDEQQYDCVIAYHGATPDVLSTTLYRLNGCRKIAWIHGEDCFPDGHQRFWERVYSKFDEIVCVSESIRCDTAKKYPSVGKMSSVCYNILDAQRIEMLAAQTPEHNLRSISLLTVGRLSFIKGQQMIPEACRILLDKGYPIYWYLIGGGELREDLIPLINQFDVQEHVILLGEKSNPYPYIKHCDIYVQPSLSEGWGLTVQEARILCKPIVTTNLPVMHEHFINRESGLIADGISAEALANAIGILLDDPTKREQFEKALRIQNNKLKTETMNHLNRLLD